MRLIQIFFVLILLVVASIYQLRLSTSITAGLLHHNYDHNHHGMIFESLDTISKRFDGSAFGTRYTISKDEIERGKSTKLAHQYLRTLTREGATNTQSDSADDSNDDDADDADEQDTVVDVDVFPSHLSYKDSPPTEPVPVVLWPYLEIGTKSAESAHIEYDGIIQSPHLVLSTNKLDLSPNVVWVADVAYPGDWCDTLAGLVKEAQEARTKASVPSTWPIVILDFGDFVQKPRCTKVESLVGLKNVKYMKRSLIFNRAWQNKTKWVSLGNAVHVKGDDADQVHYHHIPLPVRTDTVAMFDATLRERNLDLAYPVETLNRTFDVMHLWPLPDEHHKVANVHLALLRNRVSEIVAKMNQNQTYMISSGNSKRTLNNYVGLAGNAVAQGRRGVHNAYIENLLDTKIIVVTQRDRWEDHYRLFEALISGAMVLHDKMRHPPPGLEHGKHYIEFGSEEELIERAIYYLDNPEERMAIAREGRRVSMLRHRSWHRMEEVVFGRPIPCSETEGSKCPYVVHANETVITAVDEGQHRESKVDLWQTNTSKDDPDRSQATQSISNLTDENIFPFPSHLNSKDFPLLEPLPVVLYPFLEYGLKTAESIHIDRDGLIQSPLVELSTDKLDLSPNVVWVGDVGYGPPAWCNRYTDLVKEAQNARKKASLPLQWPVVIVDFTDQVGKPRCKGVEELVGLKNVKYMKRSFIRGRTWNNETNWIKLGNVMEMQDSEGVLFHHIALPVRTDTVALFDATLRERNLDLAYPIETLNRKIDLMHLWPLPREHHLVGNVQLALLRTRVSEIVTKMNLNQTYMISSGKSKRTLNNYVGLAGHAVAQGRRGVHNAYIENLLDTKIIVVTQRDQWEDHYRFFEGLISGAMVLCDTIQLPPPGLEAGKHYVEFGSEEELIERALYYLNHPEERMAIAREGRRASMMRHRSWHRMEEIVFGRPITFCSEKEGSKCPFIVHANETI